MKQLFVLLISLALNACIGGNNSADTVSTEGYSLHDSPTQTNTITFDMINIALRFSFLMSEVEGDFDLVESKQSSLFSSSDVCKITEIEAGKKYAISYLDNFLLDNDNARLGTFFIEIEQGSNLFESGANWTIKTATNDDEGYTKPYIIQSTYNAYYGDNSYITFEENMGNIEVIEGCCHADLTSTSSSNIAAKWTINSMIIEFDEDYSYKDSSKNITLSYECSGQLLNMFEGYTVEQYATDLVYKLSCYKSTFVSGTVTTYNPYFYSTQKTTSIFERVAGTYCNYTNYLTFDGSTTAW